MSWISGCVAVSQLLIAKQYSNTRVKLISATGKLADGRCLETYNTCASMICVNQIAVWVGNSAGQTVPCFQRILQGQ